MRDLSVLFIHLITTIARLAGPGGARSVVAEPVLVKQQLLILNRFRHRSYFAYYHGSRIHLALRKDASDPRPVLPPEFGSVISLSEVGGLHHRYERRAA